MVSHCACPTIVSCFLLRTITPSRPWESPDSPSLRASNEHSFIVRVLRARRMVWWLPFPLFLRTFLLLSTPCPLRSKPLSPSSLWEHCSDLSGCSRKPMQSGWPRWSSQSAYRPRSLSPSIRSRSAPLRGSCQLQPAWSPFRCSSVPGCLPGCCSCHAPRKEVSSSPPVSSTPCTSPIRSSLPPLEKRA